MVRPSIAAGPHPVLTEEDLRAAGGRSATLGVVLRLDVDGRSHGDVRVIKGSSFAVGAGDAVELTFVCLNDEL